MDQLELASGSPSHVFPIRVLKHCGVHKHILYNIYMYNTRT